MAFPVRPGLLQVAYAALVQGIERFFPKEDAGGSNPPSGTVLAFIDSERSLVRVVE